MSFKKFTPEVRFNGEKIDPDEMNRYENYYVLYPTASASFIGTAAAGTATQAKAFVITNQQLDYPRTLLVTITNSSGSVGSGVTVVNGYDQFGSAISETITALGTQTTVKAGTKIFEKVTSATITFGTLQEESGTATLGVAIGTASGQVARFGLPFRVGATGDVKTITWVNNGTSTAITGGTVVSTLVSTVSHSFAGTKIVAATDIYYVKALPSYNSEVVEKLK